MQYLLSHVFLLCAILTWLPQGGLLKDAEAVDISGTTAVGSPQPWHFSEMNEAPGEGTVAGEVVLSSEGFISLQQYQAAESRDTQELEGYWQRRGRGKATIRQRLRQFFLKGATYWKGKKIATEADLAQHFDAQVIADVRRRLASTRAWWKSNNRPPTPHPKPEPRCRPRVRAVSYNCNSLVGERLHVVLSAFRDYDIIILQGTRLRKKSAPHNGVQYDDNCTPSRWEGHSYDRQFYLVSWGYCPWHHE